MDLITLRELKQKLLISREKLFELPDKEDTGVSDLVVESPKQLLEKNIQLAKQNILAESKRTKNLRMLDLVQETQIQSYKDYEDSLHNKDFLESFK